MIPGVHQLLAFGTGAGIQVSGDDLEVAVVRVRPTSVRVLGRITIARFRERPADQWGAEYSALLRQLGATHVRATVLLPRSETIVRQISLRGVGEKDLESAIAFQMDTLHPYGDEEVLFGWSALGDGGVLVGVIRRATVERYLELFTEAGVSAGSFTFAAAAIHSAIRLGPPPPAAFVALSQTPSGAVDVYGESPARPVFSAEFEVSPERAAAMAAAELRLDPDTATVTLETLLPAPRVNPVENDLARNPLPYAAALAGACPLMAPAANLLPPERRAASSRGVFIPTAVCAALLLMVLGASVAWSSIEQHQYMLKLQAELNRLEPQARQAAILDAKILNARTRARLLDAFRSRTRSDLDSLAELTRILMPPVWTNLVELSGDSAVVSGEAEQAAPLLKMLDASPLFHNSEFSGITKVANAEIFRLRAERRRPHP